MWLSNKTKALKIILEFVKSQEVNMIKISLWMIIQLYGEVGITNISGGVTVVATPMISSHIAWE